MFPLNVIAAADAEKIILTGDTLVNADDAPGGARIISGIKINSNGNLEEILQWNTAPFFNAIHTPDEWNDIKKNMGNYEARATSPDVVGFGDALNTWFILSVGGPEWAAERGPPGAGSTNAVITVQIRHRTTLVIKATAVFDCTATQI